MIRRAEPTRSHAPRAPRPRSPAGAPNIPRIRLPPPMSGFVELFFTDVPPRPAIQTNSYLQCPQLLLSYKFAGICNSVAVGSASGINSLLALLPHAALWTSDGQTGNDPEPTSAIRRIPPLVTKVADRLARYCEYRFCSHSMIVVVRAEVIGPSVRLRFEAILRDWNDSSRAWPSRPTGLGLRLTRSRNWRPGLRRRWKPE